MDGGMSAGREDSKSPAGPRVQGGKAISHTLPRHWRTKCGSARRKNGSYWRFCGYLITRIARDLFYNLA